MGDGDWFVVEIVRRYIGICLIVIGEGEIILGIYVVMLLNIMIRIFLVVYLDMKLGYEGV